MWCCWNNFFDGSICWWDYHLPTLLDRQKVLGLFHAKYGLIQCTWNVKTSSVRECKFSFAECGVKIRKAFKITVDSCGRKLNLRLCENQFYWPGIDEKVFITQKLKSEVYTMKFMNWEKFEKFARRVIVQLLPVWGAGIKRVIYITGWGGTLGRVFTLCSVIIALRLELQISKQNHCVATQRELYCTQH